MTKNKANFLFFLNIDRGVTDEEEERLQERINGNGYLVTGCIATPHNSVGTRIIVPCEAKRNHDEYRGVAHFSCSNTDGHIPSFTIDVEELNSGVVYLNIIRNIFIKVYYEKKRMVWSKDYLFS